jgi:hypothetical protein
MDPMNNTVMSSQGLLFCFVYLRLKRIDNRSPNRSLLFLAKDQERGSPAGRQQLNNYFSQTKQKKIIFT